MRYRSFMTLLFISFTALGLVGCGSSGNSAEFVATGPAATPTTGGLVFRFQPVAQAQQFFEVDADTSRLRFRFYENANAAGDPIDTRNANFATEVSFSGLSTSIRSVRITGLDQDGVPLYTISQPVTVIAGVDTIVSATGTPVAVSLSRLSLVPANSIDSEPLAQVELEVGGTAQVYLIATYDDGTELIVGDAATYAPEGESSELFEVNNFGLLRGLSAGTGVLNVSFGGQSLSITVEVSESLNSTFSSIHFVEIVNQGVAPVSEVEVEAGETYSTTLVGIRANDGAVLGINPTSIYVSYTIEGSSLIAFNNGVISVSETAVGGELAVLTAAYSNANGSTVTETLQVTVPAPE